jgi:LacI family transcriptional regulator
MDQLNLKQLAKELNLSVSTVSRALRDSHELKQETKDRVKALAEKMGYQPNFHASSLRQNKSRTIAVIVPEIENNFFSQAINGVESVAQKKGYHVLIYLTHEDYNKEKAILQVLRSGRVDGILLSVSNTTPDPAHLQVAVNAGMPLVLFDRLFGDINVPKVTTDNEQVSYTATRQLIEKGCRNIAFFSIGDQLSITTARQKGYQRALEEGGLSLRGQAYLNFSNSDDKENRKAIRKILSGKKRPDGVFAAVERLIINTYEVCSELGIRIPQDLKVVCFSNLSVSALFSPPLTTIVQPAYEMGGEAADILFKIIEKKMLLPQEKRVELPSHIIVRGSSE